MVTTDRQSLTSMCKPYTVEGQDHNHQHAAYWRMYRMHAAIKVHSLSNSKLLATHK